MQNNCDHIYLYKHLYIVRHSYNWQMYNKYSFHIDNDNLVDNLNNHFHNRLEYSEDHIEHWFVNKLERIVPMNHKEMEMWFEHFHHKDMNTLDTHWDNPYHNRPVYFPVYRHHTIEYMYPHRIDHFDTELMLSYENLDHNCNYMLECRMNTIVHNNLVYQPLYIHYRSTMKYRFNVDQIRNNGRTKLTVIQVLIQPSALEQVGAG